MTGIKCCIKKDIKETLRTGKVILFALLALGNVGQKKIKKGKDFSRLERLRAINWEKTAPEWQGNVVLASKISGTRASVKYLSDELIKTIRGE